MSRTDLVRRFWLMLPALALLSIDVTLTLVGQSAAYWTGDFADLHEGNPLAALFLRLGPEWFGGLAVVWGVAIAALVALLPRRWAELTALGFAFGHAVGGGTWLTRLGRWGWPAAVCYLIVAADALRWCWRRSKFVAEEA